ncbi:MAG: glycoside hydrolase family 116 protein [Kiritimatiellales bacterium]|nr:glycoside hydrolase family 116 protein [Kiritimatiellales bacterium]
MPETVFTDQLFGKWVTSVAADLGAVLPKTKIETALSTIYRHNLIHDKEHNFRGWANGLQPGRKIDRSGYHARTFWIGAQLNLGSLLGDSGNEEASLDVFHAVEASLHNNHLAVGEWNQAVNDELTTGPLEEEPGKDTPRFPPYPRYKCAWEYLIRILGLKLDSQWLYLSPFKTFDFSLDGVTFAGMRLSILVKADWTKASVDGECVSDHVKIPRSTRICSVVFE